jgi:energy-coupling factor transporter ATP-binding protein EcfA2
MVLDFEELKNIDLTYAGKNEDSPYSSFGLMKITDDEICNPPIENYSEEIKQLYSQLAEHFSNKDNTSKDNAKKPNKIIAVVGVTGAGKTTIVNELMTKLEKHQDSLTPAKEANFFLKLGGKINRFMLGGGLMDYSGKGFKRGIAFIDDAHMGYYPPIKSPKTNTKQLGKDFLDEFTKEFSDSIILTTWNVFGLNYALSKNPDLINKFDKVLWVKGLENNYMNSLVRSRLNEYAIHKEKFSFDKILDAEGISSLIRKSLGNPRLLISLLDHSIKRAHKKELKFITKEIFQEIIIERKTEINYKEIMNDNVLFNTLAVPRMTNKMLEVFTGLDRTTILKRIQIACKNKVLEEQSSKSKEKYYTLNCFVRSEMEKELFKELCERLNNFINFNEKLLNK